MSFYNLLYALPLSIILAIPSCPLNSSPDIPRIELWNDNLAIPIAYTDDAQELRAELFSNIKQGWDSSGQANSGWFCISSTSSKGQSVTCKFRLRKQDEETAVLEIQESGVISQFDDASSLAWDALEQKLLTLLTDKYLDNLLWHEK
jgi:hypothetical protein